MRGKPSTRIDPIGAAAFLVFIATVPASNWMIANVGTECVDNGPCLLPVWPGLLAPSGVAFAGIALVLRDLIHERMGAIWAFWGIVFGAIVTGALTSTQLASASLAAYLVAELTDMAVYTTLRNRGFVLAVVASSLVGIWLDSFVFVWMAFGNINYVAGQVLGKSWAAAVAVPCVLWLRRTTRTGPATTRVDVA